MKATSPTLDHRIAWPRKPGTEAFEDTVIPNHGEDFVEYMYAGVEAR
jgi:hypothetical protein